MIFIHETSMEKWAFVQHGDLPILVQIDENGAIHISLCADRTAWKEHALKSLEANKIYIHGGDTYLVSEGYYANNGATILPEKFHEGWRKYIDSLTLRQLRMLTELYPKPVTQCPVIDLLYRKLGVPFVKDMVNDEKFHEDERTVLLDRLSRDETYTNYAIGDEVKYRNDGYLYTAKTNRPLRILNNERLVEIAERHKLKVPCDGYHDHFNGDDYVILFKGEITHSGKFTRSIKPSNFFFTHSKPYFHNEPIYIFHYPLRQRLTRQWLREFQIPPKSSFPLISIPHPQRGLWKPWEETKTLNIRYSD